MARALYTADSAATATEGVSSMFDSLDEQMKKDDAREVTPRDRYMRWGLTALVTLLLISGLYFGMHLIEG